MSDEDFTQLEQELAHAAEIGSKAVARGDLSGVTLNLAGSLAEIADDWLVGHGFHLARDSQGYRKFAYEFAKAWVYPNRTHARPCKVRQIRVRALVSVHLCEQVLEFILTHTGRAT